MFSDPPDFRTAHPLRCIRHAARRSIAAQRGIAFQAVADSESLPALDSRTFPSALADMFVRATVVGAVYDRPYNAAEISRLVIGMTRTVIETCRMVIGTARMVVETFRTVIGTARMVIETFRTVIGTVRMVVETSRTVVGMARTVVETFRSTVGMALTAFSHSVPASGVSDVSY